MMPFRVTYRVAMMLIISAAYIPKLEASTTDVTDTTTIPTSVQTDTSGNATTSDVSPPGNSTTNDATSQSQVLSSTSDGTNSTEISITIEPTSPTSTNNTERNTTREPEETTSEGRVPTTSPSEESLSPGALAGIVIVSLAGTAAIVGGIRYAVIHCKSSSKVAPENDENKDIEIQGMSSDTAKLTSPE